MRSRIIYQSRVSLLPGISIILVILLSIAMGIEIRPSWKFDFSKIDSKLIDTIRAIEDFPVLSTGAIGYSGKTRISSRKSWLIAYASEEDLWQLLDFPNGAIKCIAFEGLIRKKDDRIFEALLKVAQDRENVVYETSGCIGGSYSVGGYCFANILGLQLPNGPPPPPPRPLYFSLSKKQIELVLNKIMKSQQNLQGQIFY